MLFGNRPNEFSGGFFVKDIRFGFFCFLQLNVGMRQKPLDIIL
mgnify:CR=1 FL=1